MTGVDGDEPTKKINQTTGEEYHLSANANAKTAPTNAATLEKAITSDATLTLNDIDFITMIDYHWGLKSALPTLTEAWEAYSLEPYQYKQFLKKPAVIAELKDRGLDFSNLLTLRDQETLGLRQPSTEGTPPVGLDPTKFLTPLQVVVANKMLDIIDQRSDKKKLQDLGVSTTTYQKWMQDTKFKEYLQTRAEAYIGDVQHEALLALLDRVRGGDLTAIKYYHEFTGRFVESKASASPAASEQNLQQVIVSIVEIIIEEVEDRDTAVRISERLKGLIIANQVAGTLPVGHGEATAEIIKPQVAPQRKLSPELEAMKASGVGFNE